MWQGSGECKLSAFVLFKRDDEPLGHTGAFGKLLLHEPRLGAGLPHGDSHLPWQVDEFAAPIAQLIPIK